MPHWLKASKLLASVSVFAALTCGVMAQQVAPGRLIVKFSPGLSSARKVQIMNAHSASRLSSIDQIGVDVLSIPQQADPVSEAERMAHEPGVQFAEPDRFSIPCQTASYVLPNDPYFSSYQWGLHKIGAPYAWAITKGSSGIVVAVIDTGCQTSHPDFAGQLVPGWNAASNNTDLTDTMGHGTNVAGVIGASTNNGAGVAGVAWTCKVMPIKVANANNTIYESSVESGITWAADHGARVANISLLLTPSSTLASACNYFRGKGGVVVTGSGNGGTPTGLQDSTYMMTVGGTDGNDTIDAFSNYGNNVDISAPMDDWTTSTSQSGYQDASGTSIATPFVAGAAALVLSVNPNLSPDQVTSILETTAVDLGAPGWDPYFGWGRLNVNAAVQKAQASLTTDTTPPTVAFTAPVAGSSLAGTAVVSANATDNNSVDSVTFFVDGVQQAQCLTAPYSFNWDTTKVGNGSHTLMATAVDNFGNSASVSETVTVSNADTTPPTINLSSPVSGSTVSGTVSVAANASDNVSVASVTFSVDGVQVATDTAAPYTYAWNTSGCANGTHTVTAVATDGAGNSASVSSTVTVSNATADTTPPAVTLTSPQTGSGVAGTVSLAASASDNVGVASVSFYVDGSLIATDTASPYTVSWDSTAVADGTHTLSAVAKDAAGNSATSSVTVTVSNTSGTNTVDTIAPTITITSPSSGSKIGKSGLKVSVSASDNVGVVRVELYIDGVLAATSTSSPWTTSVGTKSISTGTHSVYCKAYDAAGNVGTSQTITVTK